MATYVPQNTDGSTPTTNDLSPVGVVDSGGVARRIGAVLKSGLYRLLGRVEIETAGGNVITGTTDGSKQRIDGSVKLRNPSDTVDIGDSANPVRMDPTGSTTQPISAASLPLPAGAATESTLNSVNGNIQDVETLLTTIDSVLDSIKDTDGVKKITDPLPAGTNNIGDVDVVSSALPTGAATEATLATRLSESAFTGRIGEVQASPTQYTVLERLKTVYDTLGLIKDTDGIKKILDQLPAGTNEIGKVAQGTKGAGSNAWPEVLYDASGNAVGVVLDGSVYRLQCDGKIAKASSALVHLESLAVDTGIGRLKTTLYTQDGDAVAFGSVPPNPENVRNAFVTNGTYGDDLLQDGSGTPIAFTYEADASNDTSILEIGFVLVSNSVTFGSSYFGAVSGPLTNGLKVEITSNGNTGTIALIKQNECFVNFASPGGFNWVVSSKDMMSTTYVVGGGLKLYAGTSDKITVTVQDDIDSAGNYFKCNVKGNLLES